MVEAPARGDRSLYRILSFDRAVDIFDSHSLYFAHPSTWEDPCETRLQHKVSDRLFAQCWCKKGVSDAMWRIYSPNKIGVRIRTTRDKLQDQLKLACKAKGYRLKLQDVRYFKESDLDHELECIADALAEEFKASVAAGALFLKRSAYGHESEVRAVIYDENGVSTTRGGIRLDIDPFELIQSVLVDPRAPDAFVHAYRHYLKDKLGFRGSVLKSGLYTGREPIEVA